jgi:hypothetical protein
MKYFLGIFFLFSCGVSSVKPPLSFKKALSKATELKIHDSLLLDFPLLPKKPLDTITGKKYWQFIYNNTKEIHNAKFSIAGKISSHPRINILLLGIERTSSYAKDSDGISQEVFLFILNKKGDYINSRNVSSYWDAKENGKILNGEKFNSWLSKDFKLMDFIRSTIMNDSTIFLQKNNFSYTSGIQITEKGFSPIQIREIYLDTLAR